MKRFLLVCLFCVAPQLFADNVPLQTLMIKLKVADAHYELLDSWLLARSYPPSIDAPSNKELRWQLLDANHQVITEGWINDPQLVTGTLVEQSQSTNNTLPGGKTYRHEGEHRLDSANVILRVPYDSRIKTLQIERHPEITINPAHASTEQASVTQQKAAAPVEKVEFSINPRKVGETAK